ncbi:MAG TPA: hypothetical protein VF234_10825 [Limnochordia bacterium]
MKRRAFLRAVAAAPVGAQVAAEQAKLSLTGAKVGFGGTDVLPQPSTGPVRFSSFGDWLKRFGETAIRREARNVDRLDPDLVEMRLPLNTKFRMQRERNYQRILEDRRRWFDDTIGVKGFLEWWP